MLFYFQKKESVDPSSISRADVWIRSHIKKNGEPVNMEAKNTIVKLFLILLVFFFETMIFLPLYIIYVYLFIQEEIKKYGSLSQSGSSQTDIGKDALVHVLGQDKPGRLRALGRGCTLTKLALAQSKDKQVSRCREEIAELKGMIQTLMDQKVNFWKLIYIRKILIYIRASLQGKESSRRNSPDSVKIIFILLNK